MTKIPISGDWSELLGTGENPNGVVAQTPNGTVINGAGGDGWEFAHERDNTDGERWNRDPMPKRDGPRMMDMPETLGATAVTVGVGRVRVVAHTRKKRSR